MDVNINEEITDVKIISERYMFREGFVFVSLWGTGNVYNTIVIKHPADVQCFSPRIMAFSSRSLQEHIDFINEYKIERALVIAENIEFITKCPSLTDLWIVPAESAGNGFDYSPLYQMPRIRHLKCPTIYGFRENLFTTIDCSKINGLEDIHITNEKQRNFTSVPTLRSIGLSNYPEKDLTNAIKSPVLDTISIFQCKIQTLEGIQNSPQMQCVYLYYNRFLRNINALKECSKTLKALRIENCPNIEDLSVICELDNLELLQLSGPKSLPCLSFLKKMKSLKSFIFSMNVLDGDLTPCLSLSYVRCQKNRRHYNLKDIDLPKGEYIQGNESIDAWRRLRGDS